MAIGSDTVLEPSRPRASIGFSVDVVVPCYRYGRYLRQCVESVLAQTVPVRVLIIDDASPDDSGEIAAALAREDSRVTARRHATNHGHIATYNEGIEWVSAPYMLLLSADDYLLPNALARATNLMEDRPDVGFTFGRALDLTQNGLRTKTAANEALSPVLRGADTCAIEGTDFFRLIAANRSVNIVRTPTAVVRTALQKELGGYRAELPHAGDLEMWLRLATHAAVGIIGCHQAVYRVHSNNMQFQFYGAQHLGDLTQRMDAIESVFDVRRGSASVPPEGLRRDLLKPLAQEAVEQAGAAFDDGDVDLSAQFAALAVSSHPAVRLTVSWMQLTVKRYLGLRAVRAVSPVLTRLRRAAGLMPRVTDDWNS